MRPRTTFTPEELEELLSKPTVSIPEAAAIYGVGQSALKSAIRRGELELPVISIGARRVIPTAALKRLLGLVDAA
jgi:hypothetical protein